MGDLKKWGLLLLGIAAGGYYWLGRNSGSDKPLANKAENARKDPRVGGEGLVHSPIQKNEAVDSPLVERSPSVVVRYNEDGVEIRDHRGPEATPLEVPTPQHKYVFSREASVNVFEVAKDPILACLEKVRPHVESTIKNRIDIKVEDGQIEFLDAHVSSGIAKAGEAEYLGCLAKRLEGTTLDGLGNEDIDRYPIHIPIAVKEPE